MEAPPRLFESFTLIKLCINIIVSVEWEFYSFDEFV